MIKFIEVCISHSNYLVSLSNPMTTFNTNLLGLFWFISLPCDGSGPKNMGPGQAWAGSELNPFQKFGAQALDGPLNLLNKMLRFLGPFQKVGLGPFFWSQALGPGHCKKYRPRAGHGPINKPIYLLVIFYWIFLNHEHRHKTDTNPKQFVFHA